MEAATFFTISHGKTPEEAFTKAKEKAESTYGDDGGTGTIAEKKCFKVIPLPKGEDPEFYAERLIEKDDPRIGDIWGPAGCIAFSKNVEPNAYLFFGWAPE
jgi:hypothetical protein